MTKSTRKQSSACVYFGGQHENWTRAILKWAAQSLNEKLKAVLVVNKKRDEQSRSQPIKASCSLSPLPDVKLVYGYIFSTLIFFLNSQIKPISHPPSPLSRHPKKQPVPPLLKWPLWRDSALKLQLPLWIDGCWLKQTEVKIWNR